MSASHAKGKVKGIVGEGVGFLTHMRSICKSIVQCSWYFSNCDGQGEGYL